jgi:hypothetical protein
MAMAVLTDTAVVSQIEAAVSTDDELTVEESVMTAYSMKAREMREAVAASERRVAEMTSALEDAEGRRQDEMEAAQLQHARDRVQWEQERAALSEQISAIGQDRDAVATEAQSAERRLQSMEARLDETEERRRRTRRLLLGLALVLIGVAVALVTSLVLFSDDWAIGGGIIGGAAVVLLGIRVIVGRQLGGEFVVWGGLLTALAAIVVAVIVDSQ